MIRRDDQTLIDGQPQDEALASPPLAERAYRLLRRQIVEGVLPPGQQLSARRMVAGSDLGATPLREALARLHHEGLVRTLPRRGYVVAPLNEKTLADFFGVWQLIGPMIVEQGIARRDDEMLARIDGCIRRTIDLIETPAPADPGFLSGLAEERFTLLARATDNSHLIAINARLSAEMERIYSTSFRDGWTANDRLFDPDRVARLWDLLEHLQARDGAAAAATTAQSIRTSHAQLLAAMRSAADAPAAPIEQPVAPRRSRAIVTP